MAPFDRRAQRPLPLRQIDRTARQQRQRLVEALEQGGREREASPVLRQLDREREVVQASTHRRDRLVGGDDAASDCRAADEELGRRLVQQRLDGQLALGAQMQRCARGGEHDDLAHEQLATTPATPCRCSRLSSTSSTRLEASQPATSSSELQADRFGDGRPHRRVSRRGRGGEERPVQELLRELRRGLQRQPGLARPAGPREGQEAHPVGHEAADLGQLALAAEQRPRRDGQVRPSERPEGREVSAPELVDALGGQEVA